MSAPLLSRFDLIFILVDAPSTDHDQFLSEHIMSLHSRPPARAGGNGSSGSGVSSGGGSGGSGGGGGGLSAREAADRRQLLMKRRAASKVSSACDSGAGAGAAGTELRDRLERAGIDNRDPIPPQLLRKYIAYARK